jgi:hypothetical protein
VYFPKAGSHKTVIKLQQTRLVETGGLNFGVGDCAESAILFAATSGQHLGGRQV